MVVRFAVWLMEGLSWRAQRNPESWDGWSSACAEEPAAVRARWRQKHTLIFTCLSKTKATPRKIIVNAGDVSAATWASEAVESGSVFLCRAELQLNRDFFSYPRPHFCPIMELFKEEVTAVIIRLTKLISSVHTELRGTAKTVTFSSGMGHDTSASLIQFIGLILLLIPDLCVCITFQQQQSDYLQMWTQCRKRDVMWLRRGLFTLERVLSGSSFPWRYRSPVCH